MPSASRKTTHFFCNKYLFLIDQPFAKFKAESKLSGKKRKSLKSAFNLLEPCATSLVLSHISAFTGVVILRLQNKGQQLMTMSASNYNTHHLLRLRSTPTELTCNLSLHQTFANVFVLSSGSLFSRLLRSR